MESLYEMALDTCLRRDFESRAEHEGRPLTDAEVAEEVRWQLTENIEYMASAKDKKKATKDMKRMLRFVERRGL